MKKLKIIVDIENKVLYYIQAPNETAAHEIEISVFENWTGNVNYLRKQYSRYNDNKNEIQTQVMR